MFGLRRDGVKLKNCDPIQKITPHIMSARHDSQNLAKCEVGCEKFDEFIKNERVKGVSFNYMHIVAASVVRTIALYPRLNRFVMNGRIFRRTGGIYISFVVKKNLSCNAAESLVKLCFTGKESIYEIKEKIDEAIKANGKNSSDNNTDKVARFFTKVPNFLIKFGVGFVKWLDKHGLMPKKILLASPFHTTCFITNLKSIKGDYIYHHLYDFGTTSLFVSMGKEKMQPVVNDQNEIVPGKVMPLGIVTDERFCDGFYYVSALKTLKRLFNNPEEMITNLESLPLDVVTLDHQEELKKQKKLKKMN